MSLSPRICFSFVALCSTCLLLAACDDAIQVSRRGQGAFEPSVAVSADYQRVLVAWHDNRHGNDDIYLRMYDKQLQPLSDELRLTDNNRHPHSLRSYEAHVINFDNSIAVAWYDRVDNSGGSNQLTVRVGVWDIQAGTSPLQVQQRWIRDISTEGVNGRVPDISQAGRYLFVTWIEETRAADPQSDCHNLRRLADCQRGISDASTAGIARQPDHLEPQCRCHE